MFRRVLLFVIAFATLNVNISKAAKRLLTVRSVDVQTSSISTAQSDEEGNKGWGTAAGVATGLWMRATPVGLAVMALGGDHIESKIRGRHVSENATSTVQNIYRVRLSNGSVFVSYSSYAIGEKIDPDKILPRQWVIR